MHLQDRLSAVDIWAIHHDMPIEAPGAQQRGVQDIRPVRRRDQDGAALLLEAVQLDSLDRKSVV